MMYEIVVDNIKKDSCEVQNTPEERIMQHSWYYTFHLTPDTDDLERSQNTHYLATVITFRDKLPPEVLPVMDAMDVLSNYFRRVDKKTGTVLLDFSPNVHFSSGDEVMTVGEYNKHYLEV